uniref:Putative bpti/kunitz family of serine protease inhibitor n=1 Tax=Amblyomma americanum TaxID=6943 RepID=A0A0C9R4J4_AMBAM
MGTDIQPPPAYLTTTMRSLTFLVLLIVFLCAMLLVDGEKKKPKPVCSLPPEHKKCARLKRKGCHCPKNLGIPGFIREERWFYNKKKKQCESFAWSTKGGNCNNFPSSEKCYETCSKF